MYNIIRVIFKLDQLYLAQHIFTFINIIFVVSPESHFPEYGHHSLQS